MHWNRCDYCGRFISIKEFMDNKAHRYMSSPETDFSVEEYRTYHLACEEANNA